jgi:SecD/SecF fusion protein
LALSFSTDAGCGQEPVTVKLTYAVVLDPRIGGAMMDDLVHTINLRLDEAGKARLLANQQVEVELYGDLSETELKSLKRRIGAMAMLEFRVLADSTQSQDDAVIASAKRVPASQKQVAVDGDIVVEWVAAADPEFGFAERVQDGTVTRRADGVTEVLLLIDTLNVTGDLLVSAKTVRDDRGKPAIEVSFSREGARRLHALTSRNKPDPAKPGVYRQLGIVLDKQLLSAPRIMTSISNRAMISGGKMSERDAEDIVAILDQGTLPYEIRLVDEQRTRK